jgi:glutaredoxin
MGRITIFVTDGNAACTRTVAAFRARKIPITTISLTQYPHKRSDMVALCTSNTTPQVFFNTRHIGGMEETFALLQEWDMNCTTPECAPFSSSSSSASVSTRSSSGSGSKPFHKQRSGLTSVGSSPSKASTQSNRSGSTQKSHSYASAYERYVTEIANFPDPCNPRLSVSIDIKPKLESPPQRRDPKAEYCVVIPGDQSTVLEMTHMFLDLIKHEENMIGAITYKKSFMGGKAIKILSGAFGMKEKDAVKLASQLLSMGVFHHISGSSAISFDTTSLYRLQYYQTPLILNSFRVWTENSDKNVLRLLHHLVTKWNDVEIKATDAYGTLHQHKVRKMSEYMEFEERVCELQAINMFQMNDQMKIVRIECRNIK